MHSNSNAFKVGDIRLVYSNTQQSILNEIAQVLPAIAESDEAATLKNVVLDENFADLEQALVAISDVLLRQFQNYLWIDAAAALAPSGKKLLLCGASEAGKSTLTAALCAFGWRIATEDVTLIFADGSIPSLVRPISLRPGSVERIFQSTGKTIRAIADRWCFEESQFYSAGLTLPFDRVVLIKGVNPTAPDAILHKELSSDTLARELLPCSNALRFEEGVDLLYSFVANSPCHIITGGTIMERIKCLEALLA